MNERITLLALKASDPKTGWLDRQKFAELIVQKCMSFQDEAGVYSKFDMADAIAQHFGVKE
jgi:hypothetical protein